MSKKKVINTVNIRIKVTIKEVNDILFKFNIKGTKNNNSSS